MLLQEIILKLTQVQSAVTLTNLVDCDPNDWRPGKRSDLKKSVKLKVNSSIDIKNFKF